MAVAENRQLAMPADDLLLPFQTVQSGVTGRIVRLGSVVDTILSRHAYPEPVSHALGEALALTAMLGAALKTDGKFILQTKTDGALDFLVADYETPGKVRGYASFDKADATLIDAKGRGDQGVLLGNGHVAMTIDPGGDMDRYQGIVALEREPLVDAAHTYFRQSEQLPTFIRLAVARHYGPSRPGESRSGAGVPAAFSSSTCRAKAASRAEGEAHDAGLEGEDNENWSRVRHLAATVEDHELLDPMLSPEQLLYRLFHEEGVRVVPATSLTAECRCSRERIHAFLGRFGAAELSDMREPDGAITVTCEFCSRKYRFAPDQIA